MITVILMIGRCPYSVYGQNSMIFRDFHGLKETRMRLKHTSGSSIIFIDVLSIIMHKFGERIAKVGF